MANILVVTGSIRPSSVNEKVVPLVVKQLEEKGASTSIADLKELDLPFYDDPHPSLSPDFNPTDKRIQRWTDMVEQADGVVLVTPEYNHTMSPVQLNAIDWVGKEWHDKPVALVGYGWSGGERAQVTAREMLANSGLKARVGEKQANLPFKKDIELDGSILDESAVTEKVNAALDELLAATV
jgi:NAD(P)H-dependent FMN reductase